jgi:hypothetical protein
MRNSLDEVDYVRRVRSALLEPLKHFCRMCCIVLIYMFSGMRDSEVQSLKRGCVEPFWGHLTLTGKEFKTFRGAQARSVVIEPVARAARLAESLTWHDKRIVVTPARCWTVPVSTSTRAIARSSIRRVARHSTISMPVQFRWS